MNYVISLEKFNYSVHTEPFYILIFICIGIVKEGHRKSGLPNFKKKVFAYLKNKKKSKM